jgi:NADPH-dependent curcumin reductase CurA
VVLTQSQLDSGSVIKLTDIVKEEELSLGIGLLGMPGSTAYGGLIDVLKVQNGEVLFVSAASGAVGSLVGMIAKRVYNCTVIGSAGGPEKCNLIKEKFGFDFAIDYKVASDKDKLKAALKEVAPKGIDMYFENVGGYHFEAAFESLAPHGRIAVCGGISEYNNATANKVSINPMQMVYTFQRVEGFVCSPWLSGKKGNFLGDMNKWRLEGKLVAEETVFEGIESWPAAFRSLFTGEKLGKVVVKV